MNDKIILTLNSPITDEQWDAITDVDFDHTDRIWFHTKHGKDVEFVKQKTGHWIGHWIEGGEPYYCSECGEFTRETVMGKPRWNYCPNCGADMRGEQDE